MSENKNKCENKNCENDATRIVVGSSNFSKICNECYKETRL